MTMSAVVVHGKPSLLATMGAKYGVDPDKVLGTLKDTAFRGNVSDHQMMALLIVAQQYNLNPWTKEIYAFPDRNNGIVPVVGVDGWSRIINEHQQCNGIQFTEADDGSWVECTIHRKDRQFPTTAREWLSECKRDTPSWKSHPRRMLRHKSLIQCARIAFGFAGIYDPDEAERIIDVTPMVHSPRGDLGTDADPDAVEKYCQRVADVLAQDVEEPIKAQGIRDIHEELYGQDDMYVAVADALAKRKICSKGAWKTYVSDAARIVAPMNPSGRAS